MPSAIADKYFTIQEYLIREKDAIDKHEYCQGKFIAWQAPRYSMTGYM